MSSAVNPIGSSAASKKEAPLSTGNEAASANARVGKVAQGILLSFPERQQVSRAFVERYKVSSFPPQFLCRFSDGQIVFSGAAACNDEMMEENPNYFNEVDQLAGRVVPISFPSFPTKVGKLWYEWRLGVEIKKIRLSHTELQDLFRWAEHISDPHFAHQALLAMMKSNLDQQQVEVIFEYLFSADVIERDEYEDFIQENCQRGARVIQNYVAKNNPKALFLLGLSFYEGWEGLPENPKQAFDLFWRAAKLNHARAQQYVADCCQGGFHGLPIDKREAYGWYEKAALGGNAKSLYKLGEYYRQGLAPLLAKDEQKAVWYFQRAAENYGLAQYTMGSLCEQGACGVPQDPATAHNWYQKAANNGWPEAQYKVGAYYWGLRGANPDNAVRAKYWLKKAAYSSEPLNNANLLLNQIEETEKAASR